MLKAHSPANNFKILNNVYIHNLFIALTLRSLNLKNLPSINIKMMIKLSFKIIYKENQSAIFQEILFKLCTFLIKIIKRNIYFTKNHFNKIIICPTIIMKTNVKKDNLS